MFESFQKLKIPCWFCDGQLVANNSLEQAGIICLNCSVSITFRENLPELLEKLQKRAEKNRRNNLL